MRVSCTQMSSRDRRKGFFGKERRRRGSTNQDPGEVRSLFPWWGFIACPSPPESDSSKLSAWGQRLPTMRETVERRHALHGICCNSDQGDS